MSETVADARQYRGGKRPTPSDSFKVYKTAVFKIHNPSKKAQARMRDAMRRSHLAYSRLLEQFMPSEDECIRLRGLSRVDRKRALEDPCRKQAHAAVRTFRQLPLGAKDAILQEFVAAVSSRIGLLDEESQDEIGVPTVAPLNDVKGEWLAALHALRFVTDEMRENNLRDELNRLARSGTFRPMFFSRFRVAAGFGLYRHPETKRLYAWMNLCPKEARQSEARSVRNLVDLKTGELVSFTSTTGLLLPLECGFDFQEQRFVEDGEPVTARLYNRRERGGEPCDEFELHVAYRFVVSKIETTTLLGVDRGVYNLAAYAVIDAAGRLIEQGRISGMNLRMLQRKIERDTTTAQKAGRRATFRQRQAYANEAVHTAANAIVRLASRYGSQVVLEDLRSFAKARAKGRPKFQRRSGFAKLFNRTQYEKLRSVLEYKLRMEGLPKPVRVRPAFTSQTCPECGHAAAENRAKVAGDDKFAMDRFACIRCGHIADADENAARVIGLKWIWLTGLPKKASRAEGGPLPDSLKFENFIASKRNERSNLGA